MKYFSLSVLASVMASKTISAGAFMLILVLSCRDSLGDSYLEASQDEIRVGSFNVQIFGLTKLGKSGQQQSDFNHR